MSALMALDLMVLHRERRPSNFCVAKIKQVTAESEGANADEFNSVERICDAFAPFKKEKYEFDCGVFMIKYVDFYSRDIGLSQANLGRFGLARRNARLTLFEMCMCG